ncbi:MAG: 2-oxoacid:acceptor oxidoreductase subunit alpha [Halobacteriota archaeon]|nr:2-oxoacid:acceptor oxidoreductase subunit alpha [Halobacteriota archaeon]
MSEDKAIRTGTHVITGNDAMIEGAIVAGCRFFAGYPITPQNEVPEMFSVRLPEVGGNFIQMEDEIASIAAVVGASLAGTKAMTSTSGPGFSLMQEYISQAAQSEIPIVVGNVQRTGPGSGIVSVPHHGDVMQARYGGNGDYEIIALAPATAQESFDLTIEAFNLAETWRTPAIILSDAMLGHCREKVVIPSAEEIKERVVERKIAPEKRFKPFTYEEKGELIVPPPLQLGTHAFPFWLPTVSHNEFGIPILDTVPQGSFKMVQRLCDKITKNEEKITRTQSYYMDDADVAVIAYGLPARTGLRAVREAREQGIKAGLLRLLTIWPFASSAVEKAAESVKSIIVPEINMGQLFIEIDRVAAKNGISAHLITQISKLHEPHEILSKIKEVI